MVKPFSRGVSSSCSRKKRLNANVTMPVKMKERYVADQELQGFRRVVDGEVKGIVAFDSTQGRVMLEGIRKAMRDVEASESGEIEREARKCIRRLEETQGRGGRGDCCENEGQREKQYQRRRGGKNACARCWRTGYAGSAGCLAGRRGDVRRLCAGEWTWGGKAGSVKMTLA